MEARKVRPGLVVRLEGVVHRPTRTDGSRVPLGGSWEVLDRSPRPACWWCHRWEGNQWDWVEAHARNLEFVADPVRESSHV